MKSKCILVYEQLKQNKALFIKELQMILPIDKDSFYENKVYATNKTNNTIVKNYNLILLIRKMKNKIFPNIRFSQYKIGKIIINKLLKNSLMRKTCYQSTLNQSEDLKREIIFLFKELDKKYELDLKEYGYY